MAPDLNADEMSEVVAWRHDLHRHPELAFEETRTSRFVAELLASWGYEIDVGMGRTGVVGTLSKGGGPAIALRADMDALPIAEATGLDYASRTAGKMHACGHDGHVAVLLGAARVAARMDFHGTLRVIFQPAEENEGGARVMVDEGLFRRLPVDAVYGMHNWPALDTGQVVARDDAMMAALGLFEVSIEGRGAHGAMPHEGSDVLVAASAIVSSLQTIVSRNVSPTESAVVSVTQVHGGDAWNVLPQTAMLRGTTRWFSPAAGALIDRRLRAIAESVARAYDCKTTIMHEERYPPTINDPVAAAVVRRATIAAGLSVADAQPSMAAEDFAFMLKERPGCYFWLGAKRRGDNPGLHSPQFDFNDAIVPKGIRLWLEVVRQALP